MPHSGRSTTTPEEKEELIEDLAEMLDAIQPGDYSPGDKEMMILKDALRKKAEREKDARELNADLGGLDDLT